MPHDTPLISTIVAGLVLAFIFGAIANRFKMPPLVGYLVAGVFVGPFTPGFVANAELANELSEIGVILLMFGVGLHFSLKDLLSVQAVAVPGALLRIAGGTAMGLGLALLMGWSFGGGLIFGLALSVASTVVLLKALQDRHLIDSDRGRIAVGWVIVEDIAMVLALVLIPAFAGLMGGTSLELHDPFVDVVERFSGLDLNIWGVLAVTVVKLAAFVGFMLVVGRRLIHWVLHLTALTGSRELFRLAVLAIALGVAAGAAYLFGVSLALGAFFAGMILSESELSNRAAQESLPFRDAFSVLFFVSVGMLFDPSILWTRPWQVVGTLFVILVGKTVIGYFLVRILRRPAAAALTISASLAQIGEFSFILAALGVGLGLMPAEGQSLILAGSIISIVLNPLMMYAAEHLRPQLEARIAAGAPSIVVPERVEPDLTVSAAPAAAAESEDERMPTRLTGHTVLIGYGRVGTVVADGLKRQGAPFVLIEDSEKRVAAAHDSGIEVVVGNAATSRSLALANVAGARTLLIAIPNAFEAGQAVEQCHKLNPNLLIIARAHSDEEVTYLRDLGANEVIMGEREIGLGMLSWANGDKEHEVVAEREQAGFDAVAAALQLQLGPVVATYAAPPPPSSPANPAVLEAAIEAAHPEHEPTGPAEPPELVPALGEMPVTEPEAAFVPEPEEPGLVEPEPVQEPEAAVVATSALPPEPEPLPEPIAPILDEPVKPRLRAAAPATSPASPFNPEVVPVEE
ncbi:MAG: Kef family K(+) transporter [Devosia nanyangense]|uniref:Kef family K(+) transporter n=1 Tax=Devosia nanyangense TaxID=1228055 RepID=A0A933L6T0_9HYPH|nr:Kef family K(+) transporter [Devosia nanyangense]